MIEFLETDNYWNNGASFENAEVGDTFSWVSYGQWSHSPLSVQDMKIIRAGKRDIICAKISGGGEVKFSRKGRAANCYPIGHQKAIEARNTIRRNNRRHACFKILEAKRHQYDDLLIDAIEAFEKRKVPDEE